MRINSSKRKIIIGSSIVSLLIATNFLYPMNSSVSAEAKQDISTVAVGNQTANEKITSPNIIRHEGYSRDNVAENVAKAHFKDSKKVILVNREKFPDAISATNISQGRYPVLYTHAGRVTEGTMKLLQSMAVEEIYILGGSLSVNESVVGELEKNTKAKVTRISGRSRYDANVSAVRENYSQKNHVVIASGEVYSDALYGVSYANTIDAPVILTKTNRLEASTVQLLKDLKVEKATIIGGTLTVTPDVEKQLNKMDITHNRIAGRNRYIGSAEVAAASYQNPNNVVIASGEVFSDALVSAPLAQKLDAPILLVGANRLEPVVSEYLRESALALETVYIQGGPLTISKNNEGQISSHSSYLVISNKIPFGSKTTEDDELLEGQTKIIQKGVDGVQKVYYVITYKDGVETNRTEIKRVSEQPTKEIVAIGTKVDLEGVRSIEEKIDSLPNEVTLKEKEFVSNVRKAYEALTVKQKKLVGNLERLEKTEAQITKLENTYTLTQKVSPTEGGSVVGSGEYEAGTNIQLKASPAEGFEFVNWLIDGEVVSNKDEFTFTMPKKNAEITADFQSVSEPYLTFNAYSGTITGYDTVGGREVIIPSSIKGVEVKNIGRKAFEGKNITSVILPDSVTSIESGAFRDNLLTRVDLPKKITAIHFGAFDNNLLSSIVLPETLKEIGDYAFYRNNLTEVIFPESVTAIGSNAFVYNQLTNIELPQNIQTIGRGAFSNNSLTKVIIPDSLIKIESNTFSRNSLNRIEIPGSVETIEYGAFAYNDLEEVIFNEGLLKVESSAFSYNNLKEIAVPYSLMSFENRVFWNWNHRITIEKITIGPDVFVGDELLESNNLFRDLYYDESNGGPGTYVKTQGGSWIKQ